MTDTANELPERGHNNPPELLPTLPPEPTPEAQEAEFDEHLAAVARPEEPLPFSEYEHYALTTSVVRFCDAAGKWKDLGEITTEAQSERLTDFVSGARKLFKQVDERRALEKKPHSERAETVQAAFAPMLKKLETVANQMKAMQAAYLQREKARREAEQRAAAEEAKRKLEAARVAAAEAEARNDISGAVDAEADLKAAEKAATAAAKPVKVGASSATGGGRTMALRTVVTAQIDNPNAVFMHFRAHPDVQTVLQTLATRALRAGEAVPGTTRLESQVAA